VDDIQTKGAFAVLIQIQFRACILLSQPG